MDIIYPHALTGSETRRPIHVFLTWALEDNGYESGAVEAAVRTADNAVEAFAMLCNILAEKGVLDAEDIGRLAKLGATGARECRFPKDEESA